MEQSYKQETPIDDKGFEMVEKNLSESSAQEKQIEIRETFLQKGLRCFKNWGKLGLLTGAIFVGIELKKEYDEHDLEWMENVVQTLSAVELKEKDVKMEKIRSVFGEKAVFLIESGDRLAFLERTKPRSSPRIIGFIEHGWINHTKYSFTEEHLLYPKNWINGEVSAIEFTDKLLEINDKHTKGGELDSSSLISRALFGKSPVMSIYRNRKKTGSREKIAPFSERIIAHEFGHANDWENDMDLNIADRQDLLLRVYERMTSGNPFKRDNDKYHETFIDGTQNGMYIATIEYWAEICGGFFENPKSFLDRFPEDFKLVNDYVKKNDPTFDIFNPNRGVFDQQTGKVKDFWKNKVK
ncbi:MAG: hypothetical protein AAB629_02115 [Patescibacteria group bacterium]